MGQVAQPPGTASFSKKRNAAFSWTCPASLLWIRRPLYLLFVQHRLDFTHLCRSGRRYAGDLADPKDAEGPHLESFRVGILKVGGGADLPPERAFNEGLEGGLATSRHHLGLDQKVIREQQGRLHDMADTMILRPTFKVRPSLNPPSETLQRLDIRSKAPQWLKSRRRTPERQRRHEQLRHETGPDRGRADVVSGNPHSKVRLRSCRWE